MNEEPNQLLEDDEAAVRRYVNLAIEMYSGHAITDDWIFHAVMELSKGSVNTLNAMKIIYNEDY